MFTQKLLYGPFELESVREMQNQVNMDAQNKYSTCPAIN